MDAQEITNLPAPQSNICDRLVWHYSKDGLFSVRSAYNMAVELEGRSSAVGQSGLGEVPRGGWNFLWKSKVPGKVKVFAWRLCKKALPTCSNLQRRHCGVRNECPRCSMEEETEKHTMIDCDFARHTWALSNLAWHKIGNWGDSAETWLRSLHRNLEAWEYRFAIMVAWKIWNSRNL
ncbi:hypothetical protein Salat_2505300 [Sesamum alatum]|uniref:Reverse transcriptase zinc-binding domain-containing protein n=1 Tax=Sesamum alatum TaxID=300844 RepID=A0AAE1XRN9_9LAMI|nr:hypothetical protein Salat_2505300 [Sesamum alatum]